MVFLYMIFLQTISRVSRCELHRVYAMITKFATVTIKKNDLPTLSIHFGIPKLIF